MAFDVKRAPSFDEHFFEILEHLVETHGRSTVSRFIDATDAIDGPLATSPYHGATVRNYNDVPPLDALRWIPVGDYIAVYRAHPEDETVVLEDLFYSSGEWRNYALKVDEEASN